MWITNDVSLITFVPFAVLVLTMANQQKLLIFVIIMQTIAANLGSMLTPVGNPQNLYLYSSYHVSMLHFIQITAPVTLLSFLIINVILLFIKKEKLTINLTDTTESLNNNKYYILMYSLLFLACLGSVIRLLDYRLTLIIVIICILLFDRSVLKRVDYTLLLTFVCFFIFIGNIGNIDMIKECIAKIIEKRELTASIILSQGISNVPAAVLLSAFTEHYKPLILGTNIGGLGTLIASLASLISYKIYCMTSEAKPLRYLKVFTIYNITILILLSLFVFCFS
jgi:Na+/H+ antiporter NhaD/arsenite permease-like protein